jgi:hypothetical protein
MSMLNPHAGLRQFGGVEHARGSKSPFPVDGERHIGEEASERDVRVLTVPDRFNFSRRRDRPDRFHMPVVYRSW